MPDERCAALGTHVTGTWRCERDAGHHGSHRRTLDGHILYWTETERTGTAGGNHVAVPATLDLGATGY